jgi:hypothetical protein
VKPARNNITEKQWHLFLERQSEETIQRSINKTWKLLNIRQDQTCLLPNR